MKILLVCAGGLSSSIVMKKVRKYGEDQGEDVQIDAVGVSQVEHVWENYDCILAAPQVRNRVKMITEIAGIPVASMEPQDYALANAEKIVKQAKALIEKK